MFRYVDSKISVQLSSHQWSRKSINDLNIKLKRVLSLYHMTQWITNQVYSTLIHFLYTISYLLRNKITYNCLEFNGHGTPEDFYLTGISVPLTPFPYKMRYQNENSIKKSFEFSKCKSDQIWTQKNFLWSTIMRNQEKRRQLSKALSLIFFLSSFFFFTTHYHLHKNLACYFYVDGCG